MKMLYREIPRKSNVSLRPQPFLNKKVRGINNMVADSACRAPEAGGKYCSNISPVPFPAISLLFHYI